jgi:hypothetical protein
MRPYEPSFMKYDSETHHRPFDYTQGRRSIRLKEYDYSPAGGYYVTVVCPPPSLLVGIMCSWMHKPSPSPFTRVCSLDW